MSSSASSSFPAESQVHAVEGLPLTSSNADAALLGRSSSGSSLPAWSMRQAPPFASDAEGKRSEGARALGFVSWQVWHRNYCSPRESATGSRAGLEDLETVPSESELTAKREELRLGIQLMNSALDEVFQALGTFPQGSPATSQWVLRMSNYLYEILEGCDYVQKRAQIYAAHDCRRKDDQGVDELASTDSTSLSIKKASTAEYTSINHELGNVRLHAQALLEAVQRRKLEEPGVLARWFPFFGCCTKRPVRL